MTAGLSLGVVSAASLLRNVGRNGNDQGDYFRATVARVTPGNPAGKIEA